MEVVGGGFGGHSEGWKEKPDPKRDATIAKLRAKAASGGGVGDGGEGGLACSGGAVAALERWLEAASDAATASGIAKPVGAAGGGA